jgi:DNA-binding HxlR family transcriptional regulator
MPLQSGHSGPSPAGPGTGPETALQELTPNVFSAGCPARTALTLVADKWAVLVARALLDGPRRHSELRERIDGISQKMLTRTLRQLEHSGLVERRIYAEVPPRVEYSLSALGRSLREPVVALTAWAEVNARPVLMAQSSHAEP